MSVGKIVNKNEFATLIGRDPKIVGRMMDRGLPYTGGGKGRAVNINTAEAIEWMIKNEIDRKVGEDEDGDLVDEDKLLKRARREKIEISNAKERRQLVPIEFIDPVLSRTAATYSSYLDSLPGRCAQDLSSMDNSAEIKSYLAHECRIIRKNTSEQLLGEMEAFISSVDDIVKESI